MGTYLLLFVAALFTGILMIILGVLYRKKWSQVGVVCLTLIGTIIVIVSGIMCLCLGFFMV